MIDGKKRKNEIANVNKKGRDYLNYGMYKNYVIYMKLTRVAKKRWLCT